MAASAEILACFLLPCADRMNVENGAVLHLDGIVTKGDGAPLTTSITLQVHQRSSPPPALAGVAQTLELARTLSPQRSWIVETFGRPPARLARRLRRFTRQLPRENVTFVEAMITLPHHSDAERADVLSEAFDAVLSTVQRFQRGYQLASKEPIRIMTRESLPPVVPLTIYPRGPGGAAVTQLYLLNFNAGSIGVALHDPWDVETLASSVRDVEIERAFLTYLQTRLAAQDALSTRGDYRVAVVLSAAACESLLDELLMHLMWEENLDPERLRGTIDFRQPIIRRVRSQFHDRLGGLWDPDRDGPIGVWASDVAAVRNQCVHGGHTPTLPEARDAIAALEGVEKHITSLLARPQVLARYPRTATAIMGDSGLRRRDLLNARMQRLLADPDEPNWRQTFHRWRTVALAPVHGVDPSLPDQPELNAQLLRTYTPAGARWVLHDVGARRAATCDAPSGLISSDLAQIDRMALAGLTRPGQSFSHSWQVDRLPATTSGWLAERHLVPEGGVMLDLSDTGRTGRPRPPDRGA